MPRTLLLCALCLACGRAPPASDGAEASGPSPDAGTPEAGWQAPVEPATERLGGGSMVLFEGRLSGELSWQTLRGGLRVYLAAKWPGQAPQVMGAPFEPGYVERQVPPPPPAARRPSPQGGCEVAEGRLLAYLALGVEPRPESDPLVWVSALTPGVFPDVQSANATLVSWTNCAAGPSPLRLQVVLQLDPRLALELCEEPACAQRPLFARTLVLGATVELAAGSTRFTTRLDESLGGALEVEINGQRFATGEGTLETTWLPERTFRQFVEASLKSQGLGPWQLGRNTVKVTALARPGLAPWVAEVVLPSTKLAPRLTTPLKPGLPFTVAWNAAPWAGFFTVATSPLEPSTRVNVDEWIWASAETKDNSVTVAWEGFRWDNLPVPAQAARVEVSAIHSVGGPAGGRGVFDVTLREDVAVRISP